MVGHDLMRALSMAHKQAGKIPAAAPLPPYYPFPRGKGNTRGNIWSFTVAGNRIRLVFTRELYPLAQDT